MLTYTKDKQIRLKMIETGTAYTELANNVGMPPSRISHKVNGHSNFLSGERERILTYLKNKKKLLKESR